MPARASTVDLAVLVLYLLGATAFGCLFARRIQSSERFMAAGRSLPGWAVGLSVFGSYISSISFLANPGKAFAENWNAFVFALTMPLACWLAARYFVPFYRRSGDLSAYEHLERRFGPWARTYAVGCFLLMQMARLGTILYLLSLALQSFLGADQRLMILALGLLITVLPLLGGTEGVIWTGVLQSAVLLLGPLACVVVLALGIPGGLGALVHDARAAGKFSVGSFAPDLSTSTFWVVVLYGFVTHLQNFGIDQGYVQRYVTARDDRAAARSVWMGGLLFVPVSALFFFIGTALWVFYRAHPGSLPADTKPDAVFPWFIRTELPVGMKGLTLAAVCAAAMDSNLNCMATLYLEDIHLRYLRPDAPERERLSVLRRATVGFGLASTLAALVMLGAKTILDIWWELAGVLSGGMLGLFLLGWLVPAATRRAAQIGVAAGVLVILWTTFSAGKVLSPFWPAALAPVRSPFHTLLTLVLGTATLLLVGALAARRRPADASGNPR